MSGYPIRPQDDAIVVNGAKNNRTIANVYFQRMPSLTQTFSATAPGVYPQNTIRFFGANEAGTIYARAAALGGVPKVIAVCFRRIQTVTMPAVVGATTSPMKASIYERLADDIISVSAGKATTAYLKNNPRSVGELLVQLEATVPTITNACYTEHPDASVTEDRVVTDVTDGTLSASIDTPVVRRPIFAERYMRTVYPGTTAGGVVEPQDGTPDGDLIVFPLTGDGLFGIQGAGFNADELFSSQDGVWQFTYKPADRLSLYHEVVSGTPDATFSDITLEVTVAYTVEVVDPDKLAKGEASVAYGEVWEINPSLKQFQAGGTTIFNASEVQEVDLLFWSVYRNNGAVSGNFVFLEVDTGPANPYRPVLELVPPIFPPATNFFFTNKFLKLDRGANDAIEFPFANDQTAQGVDWLTAFNDAQMAATALDNWATRYQWLYELPLYADKGRRTATTTLMTGFPNGSVRYGATWAGGAAVASLQASGHGNTIALGGFCMPGYPIAWNNNHAKGIPGFGAMAMGDIRPLQYTPVNGWVLPTALDETPLQVSMFRTLQPYDTYTSPDGCECKSADGKTVYYPQLPPGGETSSKKAMGQALTATFVVPASAVTKTG